MRYLRFAVLVIPLLIALRVAPQPALATGNTLSVCAAGCTATTIGDAMDQAQSGDTIQVAAGIYYEHLDVTVPLTISGAGAGQTIIDGGGTRIVVEVVGANVSLNLSGVTIQHGAAPVANGLDAGNVTGVRAGLPGGDGDNAFGGGIALVDGTLVLSDSAVIDNSAIGGNGGHGGNTNGPAGCYYCAGNGGTGGAGGSALGAGIYDVGGQLTVTDSTISSNQAIGGTGGHAGDATNGSGYGGTGGAGGTAEGGGLFATGGAQVSISGSTISGNSVSGGNAGTGGLGGYLGGGGGNGGDGLGGGLFQSGAQVSLTNTTLAGNSASYGGAGGAGPSVGFGTHGPGIAGAGNGGGLAVGIVPPQAKTNSQPQSPPAQLIFATIAANTATDSGGGVWGAGVAAVDTLIAGNSANAGSNCQSTLTDQGYNLEYAGSLSNNARAIGSSVASQCGLSSAMHDIIGQNPQLGSLADNGGLTQTLVPAVSSPLVDHGTCALIGLLLPAVDQRGVGRPSGRSCDIGAVEYAFPFTLTVSLALPPGGHMPSSVVITNYQSPIGTATPTNPLKLQLPPGTSLALGVAPGTSALYLATPANPITVFALGFVPFVPVGTYSGNVTTAWTYTSIEQMLSVAKTNGKITNAGTYYKLSYAWTLVETHLVLPTASLATKLNDIVQFACAVQDAVTAGTVDPNLGLTLRGRAAFIVAAGLHPNPFPSSPCLLRLN